MRRTTIVVAIVVATLSMSAVAVADDGSAADRTRDEGCELGERAATCDRAVTDRPVRDARPRDAVAEPTSDQRTSDVRPAVDRGDDPGTDRITDRRPHVRRWYPLLERCLYHHIGDRPIPEHLTVRELYHLLQRCLAHHRHPGLPM